MLEILSYQFMLSSLFQCLPLELRQDYQIYKDYTLPFFKGMIPLFIMVNLKLGKRLVPVFCFTTCCRRWDLSRSSSLERIRDLERAFGSTREPRRDILKFEIRSSITEFDCDLAAECANTIQANFLTNRHVEF